MTALDDRLRPMAASLIERTGKTMTLRRVTGSSYDPATGAVTETTSDTVLKGIVEEYEAERIDGGLIQQGDRKISLAAEPMTAEPAPGDSLLIDGAEHLVITVPTCARTAMQE
jgi:hypothetical protein